MPKKYLFKSLLYTEKLPGVYTSSIKIHDILDVKFFIDRDDVNDTFDVHIVSKNGYKCIETSDDPCSNYSKFNFKTYGEAERYCNEVKNNILEKFVPHVLRDIDNYMIK